MEIGMRNNKQQRNQWIIMALSLFLSVGMCALALAAPVNLDAPAEEEKLSEYTFVGSCSVTAKDGTASKVEETITVKASALDAAEKLARAELIKLAGAQGTVDESTISLTQQTEEEGDVSAARVTLDAPADDEKLVEYTFVGSCSVTAKDGTASKVEETITVKASALDAAEKLARAELIKLAGAKGTVDESSISLTQQVEEEDGDA